MSTEVAKKTKIRGGHKAHLQTLRTKVDTILKEFDWNKEGQLLGLRDTLKRKADILSQLDDEIVLEAADEEIDEMIRTNEEVQEGIQRTVTEIDVMLKRAYKAEEDKKDNIKRVEETTQPRTKPKASIKLPKYDIKRFNGEPQEYRAFWDSFKVAIDENDALSDVEKFTYLKSYVSGEAEESIKGLTATEANYKKALEILEQRYGNKQVIISSHTRALTHLPCVHDDKDTKKIRKLYDQIESNLRSLDALGVQPDGLLLVPILLEKFPEAMNLRLSRRFQSNTEVWKLDEMMEELRKELEARERCVVEKSRSSRKEPTSLETLVSRLKCEGNDVDLPSLATLLAGQKQQQKKKQHGNVCPYCDGTHYADQCTVVTEVSKRKDLLWKKGRCFLCCKGNHRAKDCGAKRQCYKCNGSHHTSICDGRNVQPRQQETPVAPATQHNEVAAPAEETLSHPAVTSRSMILLQTAQVDVSRIDDGKPSKERVNSKILLDSGSQRTHITRALVNRINAPIIRDEKLKIDGFAGLSEGVGTYNVAEVMLTKKRCSASLKVVGVVVEKICNPLPGNYVQGHLKQFPHLKDIELADDEAHNDLQEVEVGVLIGMEYYYDIITGRPMKFKDAPTLVSSIFGYVLSGDVGLQTNMNLTMLKIDHVTNEELLDSVKSFFQIQSSGIREEEEQHEEEFEIGIEKRGDRYYVNYPFKTDHPPLGDNYRLAAKILHGTCRKMNSDEKVHRQSCTIMEDQEENGIIEDVSDDDSDVFKTYYMPHHLVGSSGKPRIVYNCSSKEEGASLNECLQTGVCVFTDLLGVIIRFRCYAIGMTADIKQAFLQIGVKDESKDLTRFLWVKDPQDMKKIEPRRMRFTRVVFGGVSSMAILDKVNRHHLDASEARYPQTVQLTRNSMYCDDFNGGAKDEESGFTTYSEVKEIFKGASMDMRKWITSSPTLNERIEKAERSRITEIDNDDTQSYAAAELNPEEKAPVKALGIPWDIHTDELCFTLDSLKSYPSGRITKRVLLSGTTKPFDPLGMLAPAILTLKILFQGVCKDGDGWDDLLPAKQQEIWDRFLEEAREFDGLKIPRNYGRVLDGEVSLIGFGDASESAYAACIYIRTLQEDGSVVTALVAAKTRVAPVNKETMPRLELRAALSLSKLMGKVKEDLEKIVPVRKIICLTDAEIVLNWIQREGREYKQFVRNRCNKIREGDGEWFHVPGKLNAADLPSRGCFPRQLAQSSIQSQWLQGPEWMLETEENWPIRKDITPVFDDPEVKGSKKEKENEEKTHCLISSETSKTSREAPLDFTRFNCLEKLVRVVAWCRRFITNCRRKHEEREFGELVAEEYEHALNVCIQSAQDELKLESGFEKRAQSLGLYEDDKGLLRCRGRIGKAKIPFTTRFPLLIPRSHYLTELVIREAHNKVYHDGVKETLAEVRSKYWIVKGRQIVKKLLKRCRTCKILEGLAYPPPATCDLPEFRVEASRAFETVGVDFCGPVYVRDIYEAGSMKKAYIAINTCTSSRMLHLELVPSLHTADYVRSHRRFIARRGYPKLMVSDNGKTFKGQELKRFNASNGIKWKFNLSRAPWWGGMFERMVRSTKRCLRKAIGQRKLSYEEMNTILIEVEAVINNRPLVYVEEDDKDQILTPSHLFCGRRTMDRETEITPESEKEVGRDDVIYRTKQINAAIDHFWRRWVKEYLVELRENHKMTSNQKSFGPEPGDVVLIQEEGMKRNKWPTGVIQECIKGKDGVTRGATVKRVGEGGKLSIVSRPIQKLYPLECNGENAFHAERETPIRSENDLPAEISSGGDDALQPSMEQINEQEDDTGHPEDAPRFRREAAIAGEIRRRMKDVEN